MRQPFLGTQRRTPDQFRAAVVLVQDRSPPRDHGFLDVGRARCGRMHRVAQRGQVVARALCLWQAQQTDEHGRHPLRMRDTVGGDGLQRRGRIEFFHHDAAAAGAQRRHVPAHRGRVIERRRGQIDRVAIERLPGAAGRVADTEVAVGDR
ncbi:hypothetical protein G6F24_016977 [Rhizopus arrhizus]|nr:hypothetical protein G6F24_016977 [Rhizopus arrhizus]